MHGWYLAEMWWYQCMMKERSRIGCASAIKWFLYTCLAGAIRVEPSGLNGCCWTTIYKAWKWLRREWRCPNMSSRHLQQQLRSIWQFSERPGLLMRSTWGASHHYNSITLLSFSFEKNNELASANLSLAAFIVQSAPNIRLRTRTRGWHLSD